MHSAFNKRKPTFFAGVPHDISTGTEGRFQLLFHSVFLLIGVKLEAECRTSDGRIDAVIPDGDHVYIFGVKVNQTPGIALEQIREKEHFLKCRHSGRTLVLVGANYDTATRRIDGWETETLPGENRDAGHETAG